MHSSKRLTSTRVIHLLRFDSDQSGVEAIVLVAQIFVVHQQVLEFLAELHNKFGVIRLDTILLFGFVAYRF